MTDVSSSNGASGAEAGEASMSATGGTGRKRGGGNQGSADAATGAAEAASFDEAPSVTEASGSSQGGGEAGGAQPGGQGGKADAAISEAQSRLRATLQSIEARSQELRRWAAAQQDTAREVIEDKPVAVIASAFGVGLVLGVLASRL